MTFSNSKPSNIAQSYERLQNTTVPQIAAHAARLLEKNASFYTPSGQ